MIRFFFALTMAALAGLSVLTVLATANDATVVARIEVGRIATLRNVAIKDGEVTAEVGIT